MAGALIGPPPYDGPTAQERLDAALAELAVARASLRQATSCLHQLTAEVARRVAQEARSAAIEQAAADLHQFFGVLLLDPCMPGQLTDALDVLHAIADGNPLPSTSDLDNTALAGRLAERGVITHAG